MARLKKGLLIAGVAVIVILGAVTIYGYSVLRQAIPQQAGAFSHDLLQEKVTVYWDGRGVPHIYASTMEDLMFAQGFVQARERFWQMETHRRFVQGRLSELIGESMLESDILLRTIGLKRVTARVLEKTSVDGRRCLEAFADGVNACLEEGPLPPELRLLGIEPEPWTAEDSAGIVTLLAYNLGDNWQIEAIRLALRESLGEELFRELLPPFEHWETPAVWTREKAEPTAVEGLRHLLAAGDLQSKAALPSLGSNSWVIGPQRSAAGVAVLANDPHLNLSLPGIWFENHLSLEESMDVYGWSVPGSPGVIIGHNEFTAWGMTNIGDNQDLYLEKQDPDNPHRFLYDDEWYEGAVITEDIKVKGREVPERVEIVLTKNGPLVASDPPLSLRWNAYDLEASTVDAVLGINRAQNWEQFKGALDYFTVPIQTLVYADVAGNIGFRVVGQVPIRSQGQGLLPQPGWTSETGWSGYIPMRELPELLNPRDGYIATANHRVESEGYPYLIALDVAPPYRMQRITDLLAARDRFTVEDFEEMQNDWFNPHAAQRLPGWVESLTARRDELSVTEQEGLALLQEWSEHPVNLPELAAPAIFQVWYLTLMEEIFRGKMGSELYQDFIGNAYAAYNTMEYLLEKGDSPWFDGDFAGLLLASYRRTIGRLIHELGNEPEQWQWQKLQTITFENVLGQVPLLGPLVNRGPFPYGGDHMTVGRAAYSLTEPFKVNSVAGLRFIAVMESGAVHARGVIAGGQSGHLLSRHYDDQIKSWLEGSYYDLLFYKDALLQTDPAAMELRR
ncbi:MAG: penicillin acylase family protein [Firmicutes bacterium]|nr:penicillin acylase family protein [Bacillota bacterium]